MGGIGRGGGGAGVLGIKGQNFSPTKWIPQSPGSPTSRMCNPSVFSILKIDPFHEILGKKTPIFL